MRGSPIVAVPCNDARQAESGRTREQESGHDEDEGEHGDLTPNEK
jgi:hypothetical protein